MGHTECLLQLSIHSSMLFMFVDLATTHSADDTVCCSYSGGRLSQSGYKVSSAFRQYGSDFVPRWYSFHVKQSISCLEVCHSCTGMMKKRFQYDRSKHHANTTAAWSHRFCLGLRPNFRRANIASLINLHLFWLYQELPAVLVCPPQSPSAYIGYYDQLLLAIDGAPALLQEYTNTDVWIDAWMDVRM